MRQLLIALTILFLASCSSQKRDEHSLDKSTVKKSPTDTSLFGTWINVEYIENVKKTKSPYRVSLMTPYQLLHINRADFKADTLKVTWDNQFLSEFPGFNCYKFQDNNMFKYIGYVYQDEKPDIKKHYSDSIPEPHFFELQNNILTITSDKKAPIRSFKKLTTGETENAYDRLDSIISSMLIKGEYTNTIDNSHKVLFTTDGKVSGLNNFKFYNINLSFYHDYGMLQSDFIEFSETEIKYYSEALSNKMIFEVVDGNLLLYSIYNDTTQTDTFFKPTKGELLYKLKKIN